MQRLLSQLIWGTSAEEKKAAPKSKVESKLGLNTQQEESGQEKFTAFQDEMKKFKQELEQLSSDWLTKKYEIIGYPQTKRVKQSRVNELGKKTFAAEIADTAHALIKGLQSKASGLLSAVTSTSHDNIAKEMLASLPQVIDWSNKIKKLFTDLANEQEANQQRKIKLDICNDAIHLIEELTNMVDNISQDLSINSAEIQGFSAIVIASVNAILIATTGMTVPSSFDLNDFLQNRAMKGINDQKVELEVTMTDLEAELGSELTQLRNDTKVKEEEPKKVTKEEVDKLHQVNLGEYRLSQLHQLKLQQGILRKKEEEKEEPTLRRSKSFSGF